MGNGHWPADQVERRPVAALVPYARNARTHTDAQVAQIAASIREWGWTNAVLVGEDGTIIAGHGRVLAAQRLGIAEVPVMVARGWSEAQRRAYVIADNAIPLNAGWDLDKLKIELADLSVAGFDLDLVGVRRRTGGTSRRQDRGADRPGRGPALAGAPGQRAWRRVAPRAPSPRLRRCH